jgi:hypothetical protein
VSAGLGRSRPAERIHQSGATDSGLCLVLPEGDLTVRLCAASVTGALRVIDEDVSRAVVVDENEVTQSEALSLIDRAIREATNGRFGGPLES